MLGGGFIGQMHQTNKQNREMLKKEKRKPFDKKDNAANGDREILEDNKKLTAQEREILINGIKLEAKKEERQKLLVLLISLISAVLLLGLMYWIFAERFIEFWK